jgi:4-amino-4-deoxy-L-arabinose transferase-like glycosyltransferase
MEPGPRETNRLPWLSNRSDILLIGVILAISLTIRLIFFKGVYAIDDFNYLRHAAQVWKGYFNLENIQYYHGTRFLIFVPISFFFAFFGVSEITAVLWPLVASLCTVALIFRIGYILHSKEAGLYAALLAAFLPIMVTEATWIVPGTIIELVCAVSVLLFIQPSKTRKKRELRFFLSGAVFALMPSAGQLGFVLAIFFPLAFFFYKRRPILSYWPFITGAATILSAGTLLQWIQTGNPLFGIAITQNILSNEIHSFRPFYYITLLVRPLYSQGGLIYLVLIGIIMAIFSKKRGLILVASWFITTWLVIEFASSSLSEYRPLFKMGRYIIVLTIPAVLLSGMGIAELRGLASRIKPVSRFSLGGSLITIFIFVIFFGSSIYYLQKFGLWKREQRAKMQTVRKYVRRWEGKTIYVTHWLWNTRVAFFMGYRESYFPSGYDPYHAVNLETAEATSKNRYIQTLQPDEKLEPGLLLFDEYLFEVSTGEKESNMLRAGEIPSLPLKLPESWNLIKVINMEGGKHLKLYEITGGRWQGQSHNE